MKKVHFSAGAVAAILNDGSVATWGDVDYGGDSDAVQVQLKNVRCIHDNGFAFAAILDDGSVPKGSMYPSSIYLGLKGVPIQ